MVTACLSRVKEESVEEGRSCTREVVEGRGGGIARNEADSRGKVAFCGSKSKSKREECTCERERKSKRDI